ncbi:MAG: hypothetical protein LKF06_00520 [Prevotella sp.]|jgi:outer membrane protein assembly factor BamE (lipoprotein component of BamABCDE complex)|nr:hypothetical protein [Prevotella sp.]MCH3992551.1 hypothetical protein [Prevotella sp.]MCH4099104.1 hypothetical protein [Prevotella sp.]
MKKLIFSIAALAAIVVMGSCSQDSDLTNKTAESVGNVTVSLNVNSGIEVSGSSSSMDKSTVNSTKTLTTRAGSVDKYNNFSATIPTSYTAYFVAAKPAKGYSKGAIVQKATVTTTKSNSISVPAIDCNIYVTNYDPYTPINIDTTATTFKESDVVALEDSLPKSSTTLYLYGSSNADFSTPTTGTVVSATVTLTNHYAAVCVSNNKNTSSTNYVTGVAFNYTSSDYSNKELPFREIKDYDKTSDKNNTWFYMYIKAPGTKNNTNVSTTSNSTISLNQNAFATKLANSTWSLDKSITADEVYQYTVKATNGGQGATLDVKETAFTGTPNKDDLNVY